MRKRKGESGPNMHNTSSYVRTIVALHNFRDRAKDTVDSWKERGLADRLHDGWRNTQRTVSSRTRNFFTHPDNAPCKYIPQKYDYVFRPKSRWELVLLSGTVCGIEFCYAAETAFVTPILLSLGLSIKFVTMIWCLSPLIGLFLTPLLGSMSDTCESKYGRRRPFIIMYSIGILLGLILVPNGHHIGLALGDRNNLQSKVNQDMIVMLNGTSLNETKVKISQKVILDSNLKSSPSEIDKMDDIFSFANGSQNQTGLKNEFWNAKQHRSMDKEDVYPNLRYIPFEAKITTSSDEDEKQNQEDEFSYLINLELDDNNTEIDEAEYLNERLQNNSNRVTTVNRKSENDDVFPQLKNHLLGIGINKKIENKSKNSITTEKYKIKENLSISYNISDNFSPKPSSQKTVKRPHDEQDIFTNFMYDKLFFSKGIKLNLINGGNESKSGLNLPFQDPDTEFSPLIDKDESSSEELLETQTKNGNNIRKSSIAHDIQDTFHVRRMNRNGPNGIPNFPIETSRTIENHDNVKGSEKDSDTEFSQLIDKENSSSQELLETQNKTGNYILKSYETHDFQDTFPERRMKRNVLNGLLNFPIKTSAITEYHDDVKGLEKVFDTEFSQVIEKENSNYQKLLETQTKTGNIIRKSSKTYVSRDTFPLRRTRRNVQNGLLNFPIEMSKTTENRDIGKEKVPAISVVEQSNLPFQEDDSGSMDIQSWSIAFTVIGTVLLDFCSDACQSPSRTYLLDVSMSSDHAAGLSTFTVMAGLGGSIGYMMGAMDWETTFLGRLLGGQVNAVFLIVTIIFIICVFTTVCSFPEIPLSVLRDPKMYKEYQEKIQTELVQETGNEMAVINVKPKMYGSTGVTVETRTNMSNEELVDETTNLHIIVSQMHSEEKALDATKNYVCETNLSRYKNVDPDEYQEQHGKEPNVPNQLESCCEQPTLKEYLKSIVEMPSSLRVLCLTNLFCWMSLVCYSLYFTDFVGECVFGGDPQAPQDSESFLQYKEGVQFGCWGMALYSISCSIYSLFIEALVKEIGAKRTYVGGQLVYSCGMIIMALTRHKVAVILLSPTAGVMYSTLFTMPYLLIAHYHCTKQFSNDQKGSIKVRGIGTDVAAVSSMVFLSQFILSLSMGSIVEAVGSNVVPVCAAALLSACGALSATQVTYLDI